MRYQLKQKIWSWGDTFVIRDEQGEPAFQVIGKVFSWGDKLSFQDMAGNEMARIEQRLLNLMPKYDVLIGGQTFAEIRQEWSWLHKRFTLDVPGPNDYTITGSFWEYEFTFERGGSTVARVSKEYFSWGDAYGVDIVDDENQLAVLCTVVVVDLVCHDRKND
jgi:uncharacterized protein YxjI